MAKSSLCDAARKRADQLRKIAAAEKHAWSIWEVLHHDASLLLTLSDRLAALESALSTIVDEADKTLWDGDGIPDFGMDGLAAAVNQARSLRTGE